ncbi:MAG: helix-turn-helix transcriptional regulator [Candidatus Pacebacteria bacterium]|nr:helix-turn-helix transcriptional regulator [Candidatus Paceibacterota bacterium]
MVSVDQYTAIIDLIYASTTQPTAWRAAIGAIQEAASGCGALFGMRLEGKTQLFEFTGYDLESMNSFISGYAARSFVWGLLPSASEGIPIHDRRVLTPGLRRRDVFANEWAPKYDTFDCMVLPLKQRERATAFAVVGRSPGCGEFDSEAKTFIGRVAPHLQRAARLRVRLEDAELHAELALNAIEKLHQPVILVANDGSVRFANEAARRLVNDNKSGLTIRNNRIRARRGDENAMLRRLIDQSTGCVDGGRTGGALAISQAEGMRPLSLCCVPLADGHGWNTASQSTAMLLVSDISRPDGSSSSTLRSLFQLTPAEERLARHLLDGQTLAQAAAKLSVARTTVATQLRSIFRKTGANRQVELVRLLQAVPKLPLNS